MKTKTVRFDKFVPCFLEHKRDGTSAERPLALEKIFQKLANNEIEDPQKDVFGEKHFFYKCRYDSQLNIWEVQVLRLREKILPGIMQPNGTYELIQLENGEWPAESTTILYDQAKTEICMQRNRDGVSIRALEALLQQLSGPNVEVILKPKMKTNTMVKVREKNLFRRVILVADTEELGEDQKRPNLYQVLKESGKYGGKIVKLDLGFGRQKRGFLHRDETFQLVKEAYDFSGTKALQLTATENEDTSFETIDLLKDRDGYDILMDYSREKTITHERLYDACLTQYKKEHGIE